MRDDQKVRLQDLQEKLLDVFLDEADPANWSGYGKAAADMTKDERGGRHWDKKSAAGTMMILAGVEKLTANTKEALGRDPYEDDDLDAQIAKAEAKAQSRAKAVASAAISTAAGKAHGKA